MSKEDLDRLNELNPRRQAAPGESTEPDSLDAYLAELPSRDVTQPGRITAITGARPGKRVEQMDLPLLDTDGGEQ